MLKHSMQLHPRTTTRITVESVSVSFDSHQEEPQSYELASRMPRRADAPIKPDPEQQAALERSLLAGAAQDITGSGFATATDPLEGGTAKRPKNPGFRQSQVQEVLGLVDGEFKNFKEEMRILMEDNFDLRLRAMEQPDAMQAFQRAIVEKFPGIMGGDTASKMSYVIRLLRKDYGNRRYKLKKITGNGSENGGDLVDDDLEKHPPILVDTDADMAQGLRALSVSTPPAPATTPFTSTTSTSTSPPSSQAGSRSSCSSSGLMSFPDSNVINKRTTASLTPPEPHSSTIHGSRTSSSQLQKKAKARRRSPSIMILPSPPAGVNFPPANAKRRRTNSGESIRIRVATQAQSPQQSRPKRTAQAEWLRPPSSTGSPTKRRKTTSAADPASLSSASSTRLPSSSSFSHPPSPASSFNPSPDASGPGNVSAPPKPIPKIEIMSKYSRDPGREQAGIHFFLRECVPSMEEYFPAFVSLGCTLPNLKGVSTWPEHRVEKKWVPWLTENIERLRKASREGAEGEDSMEGVEGTSVPRGEVAAGMKALTAMDGLILGQHLKEFWLKYD